MTIKIGTRRSPLAMRQAQLVRLELQKCFPRESFELVPVVTEGDIDRTSELKSFGGRGIFIKELEKELLSGGIDMAVHSAKDMPTELPDGLKIGAALRRGAHEDVLVMRSGGGAVNIIGTGSPRRAAQILKMYPKAQIKPIRGNIETRLNALKNGSYDAVIMAKAAIERLEICDTEIKVVVLDDFVSAAGQGIIAVEVKCGGMDGFTAAINDSDTITALTAEREFLRASGGGCHTAAGAYARVKKGVITMETMTEKDGKLIFKSGEGSDPVELGRRLANG